MANKIVNTFENGLVKVNNKTKQPKNSYSYALNTVPNDEITDRSSRTNERGFDEYINLKEDPYNIIGHQWLGDEQYVFFIKDLEGHTAPFNEIWYVDIKEGIKELKYSNLGLNFKEAYPITSTYRTDYRNHRLIYWVDGLNDDRVIDIDDPNISSLDLSMISMNSSETKANVNVLVKDGGVIKTGQYFVAAAYEDETGYVTSPSGFSNAVSISTDSYFIDLPVTQHYNRQYINTDGSELNILSNKSLSIEISDIDTRYTNLIIYIVLVTDTDTIIYTTDKLPINSETYTFIFNGLNVEEDSTITLNDLVVSRINYYASNIINQKENRLIRGNLKIKENLINYQQIANNIQVNYSIDRKLIYDNSIVIDFENEQFTGVRQEFSTQNYAIDPSYLAKTGDVSITSKTFMRDEVYAFGISFELNDGTETDVFHIPGRALNSFVNTASGDGEYDRAFTNQADWDNDLVNSNPRWLEMNTAIKRGSTNNELAYWRSDEVYPDGYGYPADGETDSSGKSYIRHHKMPSDVLEPLYDVLEEPGEGSFQSKKYTVYARYIKLNFSNIAIPEEYSNLITKVILHYVPRTDQNKSIISKGLIFSSSNRQPYQFNIDGESIIDRFQFNSPDIDFRFKEFPITADRLKINSVRKGYVSYYGQYHNVWNYVVNIANRYYGELNNNNPPYQELLVGTAFYLNSVIPLNNIYSRNIENIIFTDPNSKGSFPDSISTYDFSGEQRSSLGNIESGSPINISYTDYPDLNYDLNSINNLYTDVNYQASRTQEYELQDKRPLGIYYDTVLYGSLVRDNRTQYGNVNNLIYSKIGHKTYDGSSLLEIDVNNGDCFIEVHHARKGYSIQNSNTGYQSYVLSPSGTFTAASPIGEIKIDSYISYITETDLNIRMRNTDPNVPSLEDNYYPISPLGVPFTRNFDIYTIYERKTLNQEYFNIYPAYNNFNLTEEFANKRLLSEFNNPESSKYENRLVYSDKQNYEDKVDNFRITRANNYKDLPMDRGQITQSFIKDDKFFVITRDALFNVYASNKTIQSIDNDNIVVGTGEFFGLEPVELISIEGGFGGTSSKYSLTESPYGYLFVDRLKSKSILFNDTLKDINVGGLNENYTLDLYKQFKELELEDKFDNPILGPGIISTYDPRLHRLLITKKDYIALEGVTNNYQGLFNPEQDYNIGDIVSKDGVLVEITDKLDTYTPKWIGSDGYCIQDDGFNNGMFTYANLVKVSDDVNEYPLDINNVRTSVSGLPQDSKSNTPSTSGYIPPVEDHTTCPITVQLNLFNTDTDIEDIYRLFVDVNLNIYVNDVLVKELYSTTSDVMYVDRGDVIKIEQTSGYTAGPWPPNSTGTLTVLHQGNTIYNNVETNQTANIIDPLFSMINTYTFTAIGGDYSITSLGESTATGYRKYQFDVDIINPPGISEIVELGFIITDNTSGNIVSQKGTIEILSEFNVIEDSNTIDIRAENTDTSLSYTVTLIGPTTVSQTLGPSSNYTFSSLPKGNYLAEIT